MGRSASARLTLARSARDLLKFEVSREAMSNTELMRCAKQLVTDSAIMTLAVIIIVLLLPQVNSTRPHYCTAAGRFNNTIGVLIT